MLKRFFLNLKGLSDARVASSTKKEYHSAVHFLQILLKSLEIMSDDRFSAICWISFLFGMFIMEKWVEFSLTFFGTLKYDFVIKTKEMFSFQPLINKSVTIEFCVLYLYCILYLFCKHLAYHLNSQWKLSDHRNDLSLLY